MATQEQIIILGNSIDIKITENFNEENSGENLNLLLHEIKDLLSLAKKGTFQNTDLDENYEIEIAHELGTEYPDISIWDNLGKEQGPASVHRTVVDENIVRFSLGDTITGIWRYNIIKHD